MRIVTHACLMLGFLATFKEEVQAQDATNRTGEYHFVPLRPQTRQDLARREALKLYGLGILRIRQHQLVDATSALEEAGTLDPEAAPVHKALVSLYLALGRNQEALVACRKTLDLDPGDFEVWALYAGQLKSQGQPEKARSAFVRALHCYGIAEHPDVRVQVQHDLGKLCEEMQDFKRAVAAFAEVVKILDDPNVLQEADGFNRQRLEDQAAETYERIVKLCIQTKDYDRAQSFFAASQKKHPQLGKRLNYDVAKVQLAQGQTEKALEHLDRFLDTQPYGVEAYELRSKIVRQLGRGHEVLGSLEDYAKRDAHNVALHLLLAREYARAGQTAMAAAKYEELARQTPTPDVYRGLFALRQSEGRMDKVVALLDQALEKSSKREKSAANDAAEFAARARAMLLALRDEPALSKVLLPAAQQLLLGGRQLHSATLFFLASLAARVHQLEQAELFYRRCLPVNDDKHREDLVYVGLIDVVWEARKYEEVVEVCRHGLEKSEATSHLFFHTSLSRALAILGKIDEAIAEANKAVELAGDGSRLATRLNRLRILDRAERFQQALAEGQALLKEFTEPGDLRNIRAALANTYSAMRDFAKAEEQLQLILKSDPDDATANNDLGYLWADQGKRLDEAERLIRKALDLDEKQRKTEAPQSLTDDNENAAYLDSLGWVLFRRGRAEAARGWLEKASALPGGNEDPVVWDHLGDVYFKLQDQERASTAWQKALGFYETGKFRKPDEHYRELKHKLQQFMETKTRTRR